MFSNINWKKLSVATTTAVCVLASTSTWSANDEPLTDNWASEAVPGETDQPFECHIKMMTKRGIRNIENLDLSPLIEDGVGEFLFVWSPLKMKGATGSPGNPVALYWSSIQ